MCASVNRVGMSSDNGLSPIWGQAVFSNQCRVIIDWIFRDKFPWNFDQYTIIAIHKNASENVVYEMVAILSKGDELSYAGARYLSSSGRPREASTMSPRDSFYPGFAKRCQLLMELNSKY